MELSIPFVYNVGVCAYRFTITQKIIYEIQTLKFTSVGNYIEIQDQLIRLRKKENLGITTPAKAINEAIDFCKTNNLTKCELDYEGFLFEIEPTSDLKDKLSDFNRAMAERCV